LFGSAEFADVAVATALAPFAAGRSGDDLRLISPWGGIVGSVQGWAKPLETPLDEVPADTVNAWMYGLKPPEVVLVTERWAMMGCAQKLAGGFDARHRGKVHRRLDAVAKSTAFAFLDAELCRGGVRALHARADYIRGKHLPLRGYLRVEKSSVRQPCPLTRTTF